MKRFSLASVVLIPALVLSGCIITKTPGTASVVVLPNTPQTFSVTVFPPNASYVDPG
jgi:PBP1b-binding outer membrane lipoprotein LpoB